jgi:ATP-binding protein involved in chromosome partitioning
LSTSKYWQSMNSSTFADDAVNATVTDFLKAYLEPHLGANLGASNAIDRVAVQAGVVEVELRLGFPADRYGLKLAAQLQAELNQLAGVTHSKVRVGWQVQPRGGRGSMPPLPHIKNIIAVASGKGGVGKSTTASNLAMALALEGAAVGLLDADIYGPSQPRMLGLDAERAASRDGKTIDAPIAYGVKLMSIGLLIDAEQPMVWRGPMVTQALNQLLGDTNWGELDYLIVDMPPGTGDTQLTLAQKVPVSGAVIVTTPQDIALLDARKGLKMFEKVEIPVLGIVENMSTHVCSKCGHEEHIFGSGGGRRMAEQYGVDLLGELPLDIRIREQADGGKPIVIAEPDSALGQSYLEFARNVAGRLSRVTSIAAPRISIENS